MWNNVSVIIPAYNEESRLEETLRAFKPIGKGCELIGVNDGSRDVTGSIFEQYCEHVVHHTKNLGKASALRSGWEKATREIIVCLDADLGQSITEAVHLITPFEHPCIDVVIGRFPQPKNGGFGFVKRRAQKSIFEFTGQWVTAPLSGQRAFRKKWLDTLLNKEYKGFGIEAAMTIDLIQAGAVLIEVDVQMAHREMGKGLNGFLHRGKQWIDLERAMWGVSR